MLKKIRIVLATLMLIVLSLLFLDISGVLHTYLGWSAKIQFLPALFATNFVVVALLLIATLIFGRVYCSVLCPLGIMQDVMARFNRKRNKYNYSDEVKWLRYGLWGLFVIAIIFGIGSFVALLEPYSSFGRIMTNIFKPAYTWINNIIASIAEHYDSYAFYSVDTWMKSGISLGIAVATFVVIFSLALKGGRTYCNTICPVGTTLSFFSRFALFKIRFDKNKCRRCGKCSRNCKASCIDFKNGKVDYSRCVVCGNCLTKCGFDALHYTAKKQLSPKVAKKQDNHDVDKSRRAMITSTAIVAATIATAQDKKKVDGGLAVIEDKIAPNRATPLTPPGSLSASNLAQRCTGCQLCVSQCPNDVLRPSSAVLTMMQPTMSYERGYCRPECNRCSQVCPAGAIQPITLADKSAVQIGHAVWIKDNCVCITDEVDCGNCERHCPVGAITMIHLEGTDEDAPLVPSINEARCIGCGACENLCPARPFSAIYVEGHEIHKIV